MWTFKHIGISLLVCILVLPFVQAIDGSCSFQGINGNEGCTLIANTTFPLPNHYSLISIPLNVTSRSFLEYTLSVVDCTPSTYSPCVLSFLVLSHSNYDEFWNGTLDTSHLSLVNSIDTTSITKKVMFPIANQYHIIIYDPHNENLHQTKFYVKIHYFFPEEESCVGWVSSLISALGITFMIGALSVWWSQKDVTIEQNSVKMNHIASDAYLEKNFTMRNCFGGKRILENMVTRPKTKFNYWYFQNMLYTWPFYPQHNDPLPSSQRLVCMMSIVLFNLLLQVAWAPSWDPEPLLESGSRIENPQHWVQYLYRVPVITILRIIFGYILRIALVLLVSKQFFGRKISALEFHRTDPSFGRKFVAFCLSFFSVLILFVICLSISIELIEYIDASDCYDLTGALICFFLVEFLDGILDIPKQALLYACYTTYGAVERQERDVLLDNDDVDSFAFD